MDVFECIKSRRSKRKFLDKEVSDNLIKELIDCARHAPYSRGRFNCEFIVIRDEKIKKKLSDAREGASELPIMTSSALIVICIDLKATPRWIESGAVVAENILLAAHSLDLGAVYTAAFNPLKKEITFIIQNILNLPEDIMPVCIIPIGYPDPSEKLKKKELREVNEMIHLDKW